MGYTVVKKKCSMPGAKSNRPSMSETQAAANADKIRNKGFVRRKSELTRMKDVIGAGGGDTEFEAFSNQLQSYATPGASSLVLRHTDQGQTAMDMAMLDAINEADVL